MKPKRNILNENIGTYSRKACQICVDGLDQRSTSVP